VTASHSIYGDAFHEQDQSQIVSVLWLTCLLRDSAPD